jgi:hypothetical protein
MTDNKRIGMVNAKRLGREHFETTEWGKRFLHELDVVVAASVFHERKGDGSLHEDALASRVGDFVRPLDEEYDDTFFGIVKIDDLHGEVAQETARKLVTMPRGAMVIFEAQRQGGYDGIQPGIDYDAWMSNGGGQLSRNSGHQFFSASPRNFRLENRFLYGSVLSSIVYKQRSIAENAIAEASAAAAVITAGKKFKGDFYIAGRDWTSLTPEEFLPGHYSGGGDAWRVKVSRRGSSQTFIMGAIGLGNALKVERVMPSQWQDARFATECLSLYERRVRAAKEFWSHQAPLAGMDYQKTKYAEYLSNGDMLERSVIDMPGGANGSFKVHFAPGTEEIIGCELSDQPVNRMAA